MDYQQLIKNFWLDFYLYKQQNCYCYDSAVLVNCKDLKNLSQT